MFTVWLQKGDNYVTRAFEKDADTLRPVMAHALAETFVLKGAKAIPASRAPGASLTLAAGTGAGSGLGWGAQPPKSTAARVIIVITGKSLFRGTLDLPFNVVLLL